MKKLILFLLLVGGLQAMEKPTPILKRPERTHASTNVLKPVSIKTPKDEAKEKKEALKFLRRLRRERKMAQFKKKVKVVMSSVLLALPKLITLIIQLVQAS
ncbi:MAG: hypothetical protein R3230_01460 [Nitrosopumilaceae archaeon]|nr:hypothetical protein [Nitrosopumilaceae archaeon]